MTNCALLATGAIDCWGNNSDGELGSGSTTAPDCGGTCSTTPVQVSGSTNATEITAGENGECARLATGHVECWGSNTVGEFGDGAASGSSDVPVPVVGITDAIEVSATAFGARASINGTR